MSCITIAIGTNESATNWQNTNFTWSELTELLKQVRRTSETMAEYDTMPKAERNKVKSGRAFIGATVKNGQRKKDNIMNRTLITLDIDHGDEYTLNRIAKVLNTATHFIYSTHSHRQEVGKYKYRLIIPTTRVMTCDEYGAVTRKVAELIGMHYFDHTSFEVNRLLYFPSCSIDAQPYAHEHLGEYLDIDAILKLYEDWSDSSKWLQHENERKELRKVLTKMEDPRSKNGLIGAFCRSYTITEAIETFIPDVYTSTADGSRWTYQGGSSAGGLVVYDDTFAHSHHESDPLSGMTVNVFDLVRIHKFGNLDDDGKENGRRHRDRPSNKSMMKFIQEDDKTKKELIVTDFAADFESMDEVTKAKEIAWRSLLQINEKTGKYLNNAFNAELILTNGPFKDTLAFNNFSKQKVIKQQLPWRQKENQELEYDDWQDHDHPQLRHYLDRTYGIRADKVIKDATTVVFHANAFHPVRNYLDAINWDGVHRLDLLLIDYLGAEDNIYTRETIRKMLTAGVRRIYAPGTKFENMLVLAGNQGTGKTTLIQKLGLEWFTDALASFNAKEGGELLHGAWIIEVAELSALKKSEIEQVKAFLTKTEDRYRGAYKEDVASAKRQCVFFGTTNNSNFLVDPTGNRRFWPIDIDQQERIKCVWNDLTPEIIDQLWAEAKHYHLQGESLLLSPEAEEIASQQQESHFDEDTRQGLVSAGLEIPLPLDWDNRTIYQRQDYYKQYRGDDMFADDFPKTGSVKIELETVERQTVCGVEVWTEILGNESTKFPLSESRAVGAMIRRAGWIARKPAKLKTRLYGKQRVYVRK